MYLLRDKKLIEIDISEDKSIKIIARKSLDIQCTAIIDKLQSKEVTSYTEELILEDNIDGYVFVDKDTKKPQSPYYETTIGNAIKLILKKGFKVYAYYNTGIVEITQTEVERQEKFEL